LGNLRTNKGVKYILISIRIKLFHYYLWTSVSWS